MEYLFFNEYYQSYTIHTEACYAEGDFRNSVMINYITIFHNVT